MQELDFDHIQINLNPRACAVTPIPEDLKRELAYLGAIAERKKFAASLIVSKRRLSTVWQILKFLRG